MMTVDESVSNLTSASNNEASISSGNKDDKPAPKKRRNLPGNPEPGAEVIAMSPASLLATNRFLCEACGKGFQRDQNLQLHRRGHNLPWKLKQRNKKEVVRKKVYVCPEVNCVHHDPSRALGDLTGIKKHFCRKHGEKKWKCEKCSKRYAVRSDWKAHSKICGTREYRCDCGTLFSRRDSFITHRAFCEALAEENAKSIITSNPSTAVPKTTTLTTNHHQLNLFQNQFHGGLNIPSSSSMVPLIKREEHQDYQSVNQYPINNEFPSNFLINPTSLDDHQPSYSSSSNPNYNNNNDNNPFIPPHMSATALMQKAMNINNNNNKSKDPMFDMIRRRPHQVHMTKTTKNLASSAGLSSRDGENQEQEEMMMMMMGNKFIHGNSKYYMQQQYVPPVNYYPAGDMMFVPAGEKGGFDNNDGGLFNGIFSSSSSTATTTMRNLDGGMQNPRPFSCYYGKDQIGNGGNEGLTRDFLGLTVPFPNSREQCDNFFIGDLDQKQMGSSPFQNF